MSNKIMPWIDALPNVQATDFQARRDEVAATVREGAELLEQGKPKESEAARAKAYFASCKLEGDARRTGRFKRLSRRRRGLGGKPGTGRMPRISPGP